MKRFAPRIYFGNTAIIYIVFFVFWLIGAIFMLGYFNDVGTIEISFSIFGMRPEQSFGFVFFIFSTLALLIMFFKNLARGTYYEIVEDGVVVSVNWSKNKFLFSNILNLEKIDSKSAQNIMANLRNNQLGLNFKKIFSSSRDVSDLLKYCSVPITVEEMAVNLGGGKLSMRLFSKVFGAQTTGYFVLLTTKDNRKFLLSPKDVDAFLSIAKKNIFV